MPNYIRPRIAGATVFFTVCLAREGTSLLTDHVDLLRAAVAHVRKRRPFGIDAWVVLPDHMHAVWTLPHCDSNYSQRWGSIKAHFSKHLRFRGAAPEVPAFGPGGGVNPALRKGEVGIWQRRFWEHHIRGPGDYTAHVRKCHMDPVHHGLVTRPEDWAFSSIHRDIRAGRWAA
ncbi:REP-associated tyrosine transposase [Marinibacterium sp. SX1]|uniref:REP-associated tyrosine transposase n=1 Tax=Marinibacterium sp. SX1 TaxID=3388424 RepID=UPI003D171976